MYFSFQDVNGWSSIMAWNTKPHAGFSSSEPWKPLITGWEVANVETQNYTIAALSTMIAARQKKVSQRQGFCVIMWCIKPILPHTDNTHVLSCLACRILVNNIVLVYFFH